MPVSFQAPSQTGKQHPRFEWRVSIVQPITTKPGSQNNLKAPPLRELQKELGSSPDSLSQAEAGERLTQYAPNDLAEKKTTQPLKFLSYQRWLDFFITLLPLCSNALVGFWEQHLTGNAIAALKFRPATSAKVKPVSKWQNPKASELVSGGVLRLPQSDIVPADPRLWDLLSEQAPSYWRKNLLIALPKLPRGPMNFTTQETTAGARRIKTGRRKRGRQVVIRLSRRRSRRGQWITGGTR